MKRGMLANHHTTKGWNAHSEDVDAIMQEYMSKKSQLYIAWQSAKVVGSELVGMKVTVSMGRTERGRENRAG